MNNANFYCLFFFLISLFSLNAQKISVEALSIKNSWTPESKIDSLCAWSWQKRTTNSRLSLEYAEKALRIAKDIQQNPLICKALFHNGSALYNSGRPQTALEKYFKARDLITEQTPSELKARIYNGIGLASVDIAEYEDALYYYNKALNVYKSYENWEGIALQLQNIGVIYHMVGRTEDALSNYLESVRILEQLQDARPGILANNYLNTAIVFMQIGEHDKALDYYKRTDEIYSRTGDILGLAHLYSNIGVMYFEINLDSSLHYHEQALDYYKSLSKGVSVGTSMNFVADIYRERGNYTSALSYYTEALNILNEEGHIYGEAAGLNGLGILYRLMNKHSLSVDALKKSFVLAHSIEAMTLQIMSSKQLTETYEQMGRYEDAFEYLKIHKQLSDSLFNIERLGTIKSLEFSYETEKKEREIEQLIADKKIIRARLISFLVIASLIVIFMLIFMNRQRKIRRKEKLFAGTQKELNEEKLKAAESEIALRKKLLLNYALRFTEKNNLLSDIQSKLKELNVADKKHINNIVSSIRMNLLLPGERQEIETLIDQAGDDFFTKIEGVSDKLTETEKRICVFLSFGFSSKDISGIMNITSGTIDNYRSAIRKKLDVSEETVLYEFFNGL